MITVTVDKGKLLQYAETQTDLHIAKAGVHLNEQQRQKVIDNTFTQFEDYLTRLGLISQGSEEESTGGNYLLTVPETSGHWVMNLSSGQISPFTGEDIYSPKVLNVHDWLDFAKDRVNTGLWFAVTSYK